MFTFCPLQGALSESTASQSLLELDGGVKVLIDVGWDETFNVEKLRELEKYVVSQMDTHRNYTDCCALYWIPGGTLTRPSLDKSRPSHLSSSPMRPFPISPPMPTAARTSRSSRAYLSMRHDQSSTWAEP